ncbi:MAG: Rieske (2Fe-2S) protein, partial [Myxococcota bacterium]
MTLSRKDFVRLTVVAVGGASLASVLPGCGGSTSEMDGGTGGGSGGGATGGGSGGGATGGGSGGGATGGGSGGGAT